MKKLLLTAIFTCLAMTVSAQYGYRDSNMIGISAGISQFTLTTDNFHTKPEIGWNAGLSVRGNFYNDFDMVYAMQFSENRFSAATETGGLNSVPQDVIYKIPSAQISLLLSYKIVEDHLSVEFGPMLQVNGKMSVDSEKEDNIISGTTLTAKDIVGISAFQFYPTVGITGGVRHFRANIMYQYGVNNMLSALNDDSLGVNFKGHGGILSGNIIAYF